MTTSNSPESFAQNIATARDCMQEFHTSFDIGDLDQAMYHANAAIPCSEEGSDDWADGLTLCVQLHWFRYLKLQEPQDLDEGIATTVRILQCGNPPPWLFLPASELPLLRYRLSNKTMDLELAVAITTPDHPLYETRLNLLADRLYQDFKADVKLQTVDRALEFRTQVLKIESISESLRVTILSNIGLMLCSRFKVTAQSYDIQKAIDHLQQAIEIQEGGSSLDPGIYTDLGRAFTLKYSVSREAEDITQACRQLDKPIRSAPQGDPLIPISMNDKVVAIQSRYFHEGDKQDLNDAWQISNEAFGMIAPDSALYPMFACNVGSVAQQRFNDSGDVAHLDQALDHIGKAISKVDLAKDISERAEIFEAYSHALLGKYKCSGSTDFLERASGANTEAIQLVGPDNVKAADFVFFESVILHEQANASGRQDLLKEAIAKAEGSLQRLLPNSHILADNLFKLCSMNLALFRSSPEPRIIQAAIDYGVRCTSIRHKDSPRKLEAHNVLSNAYFARFEVERGRVDLDKAIEIGTFSIRVNEDMNQPEYLTNLASKLRSRAIRYNEVDDIKRSVNYIQRASKLRVPSARIKGFVLGSMSLILLDSCRLNDNLDEVLASIDAGKEALSMSKNEDGSSADMLVHLGNAHFEIYTKTGDPKQRGQAVDYGRKALLSSPRDYYKKCMILERLGAWLHESYTKDQDLDLGKEANAIFREALELENASPTFRVQAGRSAAAMHVKAREWDLALECLQKTVSLFPQISPRMLSREDQQFGLARLTGLAAVGASCALNAGKTAGEALEILEAGRGIISSWRISSQRDVYNLEKSSPKLAEEYVQLRRAVLDIPSDPVGPPQASDSLPILPMGSNDSFQMDDTEIYRNKALKLMMLEKKIREEVDSHFQAPLTLTDFSALAKDAPIVELNLTQIRSDAFLITKERIRVIALPHCDHQTLWKWLESDIGLGKITTGLPSTRKERNAEMRVFLAWLWDAVVKGILDELGIVKSDSQAPQRIFWVTNGVAGLCPLHAAGRYDSPDADNCLKRTISTYVTTLKALRSCSERKFNMLKALSPAPLVVGMDKTIGQTDLAANEEARAVKKGLEHGSLPPPDILLEPSKAKVLKALKDREIVHFACHGYADPSDPSRSRLLLHDSITPGTPDSLTLYDLLAANEDNAQIAYLSACSTAENAAHQLIDESIHMAAAFQLIGFTHVVGTLWPVGDRAAVSVAGSFYSHMVQRLQSTAGPNDTEDHGVVARALHKAVEQLRTTKVLGSRVNPVDDVLSWAMFVHFGA